MADVKYANVLGTEYKLNLNVPMEEDIALVEALGYCDYSTREITTRELDDTHPLALKSMDVERHRVIRHELIHAYLEESGLSSQSWAENEEMVDFFAIQFPKMVKTFQELGVL